MSKRRFWLWPSWKGSGWFHPTFSCGPRKRRVHVGVCSHGTSWQLRLDGFKRGSWYIVLRGRKDMRDA